MRGGFEVAEKVALVISKSWLRTAGKKIEVSGRLDGNARRMINTLVQLRTLKNWKSEPEWWDTAGESVKQVYINQQPVVASKEKGISEVDLAVEIAPVVSLKPVPT
jgi:hypothetical protein